MPKPVKLSADDEPQKDKPTESTFDVPQPAAMPEGVTGQLPVPPGEVVTAEVGGESEAMQTLRRIGWTEGQPIPESLKGQLDAAVLAANEEIAAAAIPQTTDIGSKPVELDTKDISELSPEKQREVEQTLKDVLAGPVGPQAPPVPTQQLEPPTPSAALDELEKATQLRQVTPTVKTADDFPNQQDRMESDTGTSELARNCQHCGWDLAMPDPTEPTDNEKHTFLQSVLGMQTFTQSYPLLGGNVMVRFRTLTTREIDACYQQLYRERDRGELVSDLDFVERITRLRLYLQIQRYYTKDGTKFDHDLPDGLSKSTNPNAEVCWDQDMPDTQEPLLLIEKHLQDNVLVNETVSRIVLQACNRFNRLVSKLEAMVDNENFWRATS